MEEKENVIKNLESDFRKYLEKCKNSNGDFYEKNTVDTYCGSLRRTAKNLKIHPPLKSTNIFEYTNSKDFQVISERIFSAPNLAEEISLSGNGAFKMTLKLYSDFLKNREGKESKIVNNISKNTILYGPPGTGKTYSTILYAVAIIENKSFEDVSYEDYTEIHKRYNQYKDDGLVEFITFHQSYSYEEFIEGIKPILSKSENDGNIQYDVVDGIFKKFCENVISNDDFNKLEMNDNPVIWKVSLGGTGINEIRNECLENNHIRIAYDQYGESLSKTDSYEGKHVLERYYDTMQIGDVVLSCFTSREIDAIGVITGDVEWNEEYSNYRRVRKVNWLVKGIKEDILSINNGKNMSNPAVHKLNVSLNDVLILLNKVKPELFSKDNSKFNKVFIIDEINRGNISKIFGELITLIEPSKRKGNNESIEVKLPYSLDKFSVPDNIYLIGTMNTADRSITAIDTALRRRFNFKEMQPNPEILSEIYVDGVSIKDMLISMNKKITLLYDREHTIGHSFFIPLKKSPSIELLSGIFKDNIIPLLQEYFYEDYEKIRMVLGDNKKNYNEQFVISKESDFSRVFGDNDINFDDISTYEINLDAFTNINSYKSI